MDLGNARNSRNLALLVVKGILLPMAQPLELPRHLAKSDAIRIFAASSDEFEHERK